MSGDTGTRRRPPAAGRKTRPDQLGRRSSRTRFRPTRSGMGRFVIDVRMCPFVPRPAPQAASRGSDAFQNGDRHLEDSEPVPIVGKSVQGSAIAVDGCGHRCYGPAPWSHSAAGVMGARGHGG